MGSDGSKSQYYKRSSNSSSRGRSRVQEPPSAKHTVSLHPILEILLSGVDELVHNLCCSGCLHGWSFAWRDRMNMEWKMGRWEERDKIRAERLRG